MSDSIKEIVVHIRSREKFPTPQISVYDLLEHYGMGMYHTVCCNHIVAEWDIDERHIQINYLFPGDLILDYIGLMICDEILTGYISEDTFKGIIEYFRTTKQLANENNKMIELLQKISSKDLRSYMKEPKKFFGEQSERIIPMIKAELSARHVWNHVFRKVRKATYNIFVRIKYWRIFSLMKQCAREIKAEEAEKTEN